MRRPAECNLLDESWLGWNATRVDLERFWMAFDILYHNTDMLESRGLLRDDPEEVPRAIEDWLWDDGNWSHRLDEILGDSN